jgi:hypothetical protein
LARKAARIFVRYIPGFRPVFVWVGASGVLAVVLQDHLKKKVYAGLSRPQQEEQPTPYLPSPATSRSRPALIDHTIIKLSSLLFINTTKFLTYHLIFNIFF